MSRTPWLGRSTGRHAAGGRGRGKRRADEPALQEPVLQEPALQEPAPREAPRTDSPDPAPSTGTGLLGAPTTADAPLVSPVSDTARAAAADSAAALPDYVPPGADPLIIIDALGRKCPIPIIWLAERIGEVPVGSVIAVLADDPAAYTDIPAWCGLKSHGCVFRVDYATGWAFGIRRLY